MREVTLKKANEIYKKIQRLKEEINWLNSKLMRLQERIFDKCL